MPPPPIKVILRRLLYWHNPIHREPLALSEFEAAEIGLSAERQAVLIAAMREVFPEAADIATEAKIGTLVVWIARCIQQRYDLAPPVAGIGRWRRGGPQFLYTAWRDADFAHVPADGAFGLIGRVVTDDGNDPETMLRHVTKLNRECARRALNQQPRALAAAAQARGLAWKRLLQSGMHIAVGLGAKRRIIRNSMGQQQPAIGTELARDKASHLHLLEEAGIPSGSARLVNTPNEALQAAAKLGYPVALKPVASSFGKGVIPHIDTPEAMKAAAAELFQDRDAAVVQRFFAGADHRLLVIGDKLVAAARRLPPVVTGDGKATITELIARLNSDPRRGRPTQAVMDKVQIDSATEEMLTRQGLTLDSVPEEGKSVRLKQTANIHTGGIAEDVTDSVHPDTVALAVRATRLLALEVAGVDIITEDITRSWREVPIGVCEVNGTPGMRPHWIAEDNTRVENLLLDAALADAGDGRVPVAILAAGEDTADACDIVGDMLTTAGIMPGMATAAGIRIGSERVAEDPSPGILGARKVLADPGTETALLETRGAEVRSSGFVLETWDVGVVADLPEAAATGAPEMLTLKRATKALVVGLDHPLLRAAVEAELASANPRWIVALTNAGAEADPQAAGLLATGGALVGLVEGVGITVSTKAGSQQVPVPAANRADALATAIALALELDPAAIMKGLAGRRAQAATERYNRGATPPLTNPN